jgi:hypothetical protein
MLREAPLLPDRAVTGLLEPRIGAIGSMVTSQTGQHLCDRGRLVQFVGAATSGKVFGEALAFSSKRCDGRTLSFRLGAQDAPRFPSSDRTKLLASTKAAGPDVADPSDTAGDTPGSDSARRFAPGGLRHVDPEE